jgi:hypothetical protein
MTMRVDEDVRGWLEAETAGRADEADLRFQAVGRRLERVAVPAGFADAVMARIAAAHVVRDVYATRWVRVAVAAALVLVGGVGALVPLHVWAGGLLESVQLVAVGASRVLIAGRAWIAGGFALWSGLADAAAVIGRQVFGPLPLGLLAVNLAVALCAFAALRRLMAVQEN